MFQSNFSDFWFDIWHNICVFFGFLLLLLFFMWISKNQEEKLRVKMLWRKRRSEKYEKLRHLLDGKLYSSFTAKTWQKCSSSFPWENFMLLESALGSMTTFFLNIFYAFEKIFINFSFFFAVLSDKNVTIFLSDQSEETFIQIFIF